MSNPAPVAGNATQNVNHSKKSKSTTAYAIIGGFIFLFLIAPRFIHFSGSKENKSEKKKYEVISEQKNNSFYDTISVSFTGDYNEITYLPAGCKFVFMKSTVAYSVKNMSDEEVSGEKGQDVSDKFPTIDYEGNKELRFKGQNGKSGHIVILFVSKN